MDPAHSTAQIAADPCENEGFGGDPFESMDDPMRNEDLIDNLGGTDSISGDQRENDGMGDETAHDTAKNPKDDNDVISGDQIDKDEGDKDIGDSDANTPKDVDKTVEVEKRRRSTRIVSKSLKYIDSVKESDVIGEPSVKKRRTESLDNKNEIVPRKRGPSLKADSQSQKVKMDNEHSKGNETEKNELKCPECEFHTRIVSTWISHLRYKHSTTPLLAGCLLRCDCGYESFSRGHSYECEISNFTVIRKGNGPILKINMTPPCVLCNMHPRTPRGYSEHLRKHHKTTLLKNGIFLLCSCGLRFNSCNDKKKHDKKCSGNEFTLHKLEQPFLFETLIC
ncbi:hypothetical protein PMAYCL1PPCAC_20787 [Pristionchus mayeri]|uniref:C2H2-type domain-containing protein n=1 Tax=Pristionchus mayeri TaxID=1317129 RepID=A0AAN5I3E7_9BILA|nr:hypothetical protein PMAYCL1PPCAC_20787 [Pristionchus mayeri]